MRSFLPFVNSLGLCALASSVSQAAPVSPAQAPTVARAYVHSEPDNERNIACNALMGPSRATVEAALQRSGTQISKSASNDAMRIALSTNSLSAGSSLCAVSYRIRFYTYQSLRLPGGQTMVGVGEFCSKAGIMTGDKSRTQSEVDSAYSAAVDSCVSEIQQKVQPASKKHK